MARLFAAMIVARMPIGIDGIATVLFLRHEGKSFAVAGATAGALALGSALGAPFAARLIDRLSARVLVWLALGHAVGLLLVIALAVAGAPSLLLLPVAFLTGPAASFGTATFGTITQQAGFSRLAQLLLRFDF